MLTKVASKTIACILLFYVIVFVCFLLLSDTLNLQKKNHQFACTLKCFQVNGTASALSCIVIAKLPPKKMYLGEGMILLYAVLGLVKWMDNSWSEVSDLGLHGAKIKLKAPSATINMPTSCCTL